MIGLSGTIFDTYQTNFITDSIVHAICIDIDDIKPLISQESLNSIWKDTLLVYFHAYSLTLSPYSDMDLEHMRSVLEYGSLLSLKMGEQIQLQHNDIFISGSLALLETPFDLETYKTLDTMKRRQAF